MVVKIVIKTLYLWVYWGYMFIYTCNLITVLVSHCKHLIDYFISVSIIVRKIVIFTFKF